MDILARMRQLHGTTAEWTANSTLVLGDGEIGVEVVDTTTTKLKVGDGTRTWAALPYIAGSASTGTGGGGGAYVAKAGDTMTGDLKLEVGAVKSVIKAASGNLGLNSQLTHAWKIVEPVIELGTHGVFVAGQSNAPALLLGTNCWFDGTKWKHSEAGPSSYLRIFNGEYSFFNATSAAGGFDVVAKNNLNIDDTGNTLIGNDGNYFPQASWTTKAKFTVVGDRIDSTPTLRVTNTSTATGAGVLQQFWSKLTPNYSALIGITGNTSPKTAWRGLFGIGTESGGNDVAIICRDVETARFLRGSASSNSLLLIGYQTENGTHSLQVNGTILATSATIATSDARYKENVAPITGALDLVNRLNPVSFDWKKHPVHNFDTSTTKVGFIAQEVEAVLAGKPYQGSVVQNHVCTLEPEVKADDGTVTKPAVTEDFKGIAEGNLIAILTAAVKELSAKVAALEARLP